MIAEVQPVVRVAKGKGLRRSRGMREYVIKVIRFGLISVQPECGVRFRAMLVVVEAVIKAGKSTPRQPANKLDMVLAVLLEHRA